VEVSFRKRLVKEVWREKAGGRIEKAEKSETVDVKIRRYKA